MIKWGCIVGCGGPAAACAISGVLPVFLLLGGAVAVANLAVN